MLNASKIGRQMKAVLILSGGLDSTTLLYKLLADGYLVDALTFNYGQKHKKEIDCAIAITSRLDVAHHIIDLSTLAAFLGESALLGKKEVPSCHYTEEAARQTVVPNRNMIMLSVAAGYAEAHEITELFSPATRTARRSTPTARRGSWRASSRQ